MKDGEGSPGSAAHGIISIDFPDASYERMAFTFEGNYLGCPPGWKGFRESCYFIAHPIKDSDNAFSWQESQKRCQAENANLACIDD